jgi:hypothetical protein
VLPPRGSWPPGFRIDTTVGPRFCTDSTVRLPGSNQRGKQPSLGIEADSPRRGGQARAAAFPGYAAASPAHRARNGLFAFVEGLRRLAELDTASRVTVPELEAEA